MCGCRAVAEDAQAVTLSAIRVAAWLAGIDRARFGEEVVAKDGAGAAARIGPRQMQADAPVVREGEGDRRVGQCDALDGVGAMRELGGFRLEEFPPRRRVVVEVAHLDDGAGAERGRFRCGAGFGVQAPGMARVLLAAGQRQARDGGDRGQRLAAEAKRGDSFEVVERGDLRRGVAGQREREFILGDAAAVVGNADQFDAAFLQLDLDRLTAGVEGVFEQFLEYRRGALDDFAGRNLADQQVGKKVDRRRGGRVF